MKKELIIFVALGIIVVLLWLYMPSRDAKPDPWLLKKSLSDGP